MQTFVGLLFAILAAIAVAGIIALLQIGANEIFRKIESKWGIPGVIILLLSWLILLPVLMLASILYGLYRFITVKPHYV